MMKNDSHNKQSFVPHALSRQVQGARIIYITSLTRQPISNEEIKTITWISERLGEGAWKDALIVFVNTRTMKLFWNRASVLKQHSNTLRLAIAANAGWDIASSIVTITIDGKENPLTDCQRWLEKYTMFASKYHLILAETREEMKLSVIPQQHCTEKAPTGFSISCNAKTFACFYLLSVPISVVCLLVGGPVGYEIVILSNLLLWIVVSVLCTFFFREN